MPDDALAQELYRTAREKLDVGLWDEAIPLLEASCRASPHFKTLELLGEALSRLHRTGDAIVPLAAATALNEQSRAPSLLAEAFLTLNHREDARRFAQLALARSPENRRAKDVLKALDADRQASS